MTSSKKKGQKKNPSKSPSKPKAQELSEGQLEQVTGGSFQFGASNPAAATGGGSQGVPSFQKIT